MERTARRRVAPPSERPPSTTRRLLAILIAGLLLPSCTQPSTPSAVTSPSPPPPPAAAASPFSDYRSQSPGTVHHIRVADLPKPFASISAANLPIVGTRPPDAQLHLPPGFSVALCLDHLATPRVLRTAPNGDVFLAESSGGRIRVLRGFDAQGHPATNEVFASDLKDPYGIAFYPPGPQPRYIYVACTTRVVRYPYTSGDLKAAAPPTIIVDNLPSGGHWTRDVVFSKDGTTMFVAVGSQSNDDDPDRSPTERERARIVAFDPGGGHRRVYASGIRNPSGLAVHPQTGALWTTVNERDGLGDNLVPDYITHVEDGAFYGWPYFYIGRNRSPRYPSGHDDLQPKVPDILLQPHNASLQLTFYSGSQFPARYRGGIFACEHGSWNRSVPTGYEVIFIPPDSKGEYEDFLTGFVSARGIVWGRPVGVTTAADGSLLVSDDGSNSIWRIQYRNP